MNGKAFLALLARDAHVARRNLIPLLFQTFLQPLLFVFIFGRVMVGSGYLPATYKSLLLPGIMAISMVFTGIWAVAMPLIGEFQFTREIEDRLLAPIDISWVAVEKVVAGLIQAWWPAWSLYRWRGSFCVLGLNCGCKIQPSLSASHCWWRAFQPVEDLRSGAVWISNTLASCSAWSSPP